MSERVTRRELLRSGATLGLLATAGVAACGKKRMILVCSDTGQLTPAELQIRTTLAYADVSADPSRVCAACQQFVPAAPNACGTCKILKGPVSPKGSCKSFLAKPPGA